MDCKEASRLLYDYLNGELDEPQLHHLQSHLGRCPVCKAKFEFEQRLQELLVNRVPRETAPPQLRLAILDGIHQWERPRTSFSTRKERSFLPPAIVLAPVGLVVVFLAILLFTSTANHQEPVDILVQNHIQATASAEKLTYSSSDPGFVSSHLERELGFQTPLVAYVGSGVTLKGGEVVAICNCKVGLVYFSREGVGISLFLCNRGELPCPKMDRISHRGREYLFTTTGGFNLLVWEEGECECIAVSRLPRGTLLDFASHRA